MEEGTSPTRWSATVTCCAATRMAVPRSTKGCESTSFSVGEVTTMSTIDGTTYARCAQCCSPVRVDNVPLAATEYRRRLKQTVNSQRCHN